MFFKTLTLSAMKSTEFATSFSRRSLGRFIRTCLFSKKPGIIQYLCRGGEDQRH